jgi:hypothetical protein
MNGMPRSSSPEMAERTSSRTQSQLPMLTLRIAAVLTALAAVNAPMALAQDGAKRTAVGAFGVSLVQTRPVGALGSNIGFGYGVAGTFVLPLDRAGVLSLRAGVGASQYGSDTDRTAFSETVGGRVEVDVRTSNIVAPADVGLELTLPAGPVRPYVNTGAALLWFFTESSVEPTSGVGTLATTVNQSDLALGWTFGGGFYVPLRSGARNVMLDIGGQFVRGGNARYLAPGSISDLPNGEISIEPMESSTHLVTLRLGVRFGW